MININELTEQGLTKEQAIPILGKVQQYIKNVERELEEKWEQKQKEKDMHTYVEKELMLSNARNIKATKALIDIDKFIRENADKDVIRKRIKELKQDKKTSFLFLKEKDKYNITGNSPFESNIIRPRNPQDMSYEELCEYYDKID